MRKQDMIFLLWTFGSMGAGLLLPGLGEPLAFIPPVILLVQILLCFLVSLQPGRVSTQEATAGLWKFTFFKMVLAPLLCGGLFFFIAPEYALAAVLLAGTACGVMSPFVGSLVGANVPFLVSAVVVTSLVMPVTMPLFVTATNYLLGQAFAGGLWLGFLQTGLSLVGYIIIPFVTAKVMWGQKPGWAERVLSKSYFLNVASISISMFIIYSRYAKDLLGNVALVGYCSIAAMVLALACTGLGILAGKGERFAKHMSYLVAFGTTNNVMMVILSSQFFGIREVLTASLYSVASFLLLFVYKGFSKLYPVELRGG